nr:uncharacterized protein LOC124816398 [Hydra vulgaris]
MPLFKIWSGDHLVKRAVIAEDFDTVIVKVSEKFQFSPAKIVVNSDRTEIDKSDVLLSLSSEVLLALRDGEEWQVYNSVTATSLLKKCHLVFNHCFLRQFRCYKKVNLVALSICSINLDCHHSQQYTVYQCSQST